jgi:hypothetical protein
MLGMSTSSKMEQFTQAQAPIRDPRQSREEKLAHIAVGVVDDVVDAGVASATPSNRRRGYTLVVATAQHSSTSTRTPGLHASGRSASRR